MATGFEPFTVKHGFAGGRCGDNDVGRFDSLTWMVDRNDLYIQQPLHFLAKEFAFAGATTVDIDDGDGADGADAHKLCNGLRARPDQTDDSGIFAGQIFGSDGTGAPGAHGTDTFGLEDGEQLTILGTE